MMIRYQFIMSHRGELPSAKRLGRIAGKHNGRFITSTWYDTGNGFQRFLDGFYPLFDPMEHMGKMVTMKFASLGDCDRFRRYLEGRGVDVVEELERSEVAA